MDRIRGELLRGAVEVRDLGGVAGIGLLCSSDLAFLTQKWTVDLGRAGLSELAITANDQPASQRARSRGGSISSGRLDKNLTSSSGSLVFFFIPLSYRVF
jgi:hypothetical protein